MNAAATSHRLHTQAFRLVVGVQAFSAGTPGNEFYVLHVYGTPYEVGSFVCFS
jgi:hypothetical protein